MKMTVIGAGYVGISTALCFAHAGHKTTLLECDAKRLAELQAGHCPFYEPLAQEWLTELSDSGMISVTSSPAQAIPLEILFGLPLILQREQIAGWICSR